MPQFGYPNSAWVDSEGLSGEMYVLWDSGNIKLEALTQTQQELHFSAQVSPGYPNIIIYPIHASKIFNTR